MKSWKRLDIVSTIGVSDNIENNVISSTSGKKCGFVLDVSLIIQIKHYKKDVYHNTGEIIILIMGLAMQSHHEQ